MKPHFHASNQGHHGWMSMKTLMWWAKDSHTNLYEYIPNAQWIIWTLFRYVCIHIYICMYEYVLLFLSSHACICIYIYICCKNNCSTQYGINAKQRGQTSALPIMSQRHSLAAASGGVQRTHWPCYWRVRGSIFINSHQYSFTTEGYWGDIWWELMTTELILPKLDSVC